MTMSDSQMYISRQPEDELYADLQKRTLDELQHLSGNVWTDYNPHDPGVTIADIANYALTELAYKLGFDLEDYLADNNGKYPVEKYGLFTDEKVYPVSAVTEDDYRKLILAQFPVIENVKVETDSEHGIYHFRLRLSPFFKGPDITERVRRFFHKHRNLCENVDEVTIDEPKNLLFSADMEIEAGSDATDVLVQVFYTTMQYLAGSVKIEPKPQDGFATLTPEDWYDGPVGDLRVTIPEQKDTETELYHTLMKIDGIKGFKTCYFYDDTPDGICDYRRKNDFKDGYKLDIPNDLSLIKVRIGNEEVAIDTDRFKEKLRALYFTKSTSRIRYYMQERDLNGGDIVQAQRDDTMREANYRDVYEHFPIENDLPRCYRTNEGDFTRNMADEEKAQIRNFGSYLEMFDLVMERGLKGLDNVKALLSLREASASTTKSKTLSRQRLAMRKNNDRFRDITEVKHRYLDFIDNLYGVDSDQKWLREFGGYGESEEDYILRRMKFLRALPDMTRDRFKATDIMEGRSIGNVAVVKRYISLLLGFHNNELVSVGNILPSHNLILMGEGQRGKHLRDRLNSMLIDEKMLNEDAVIPIEPDDPPVTEDEKLAKYEELRRDMPIFNSNFISGGLFRGGIKLSSYKLVRLEREYLLVYRNEEENEWMNLGRSDDKKKLNGWANTLRRYLQELNSLCEAVYVVEKSLFDPTEPFTVAMVFTGWTARTHSPRFREVCTQLVRSMLPAHLKMETYWLGAAQMQYFEECYHRWRDGLDGSNSPEVQKGYQIYMMRILSTEFTDSSGGDDNS